MTDPTHILITGASAGIGAALAREYATAGIRLALTGRDRDRLDQVAADCRAKGAEVVTWIGDVRHGDDLAAWMAEQDQSRPLDLVIANAGVTGGVARDGELERWEDMRSIIAVNLEAAMRTGHEAARLMLSHGGGRVVLVGSLQSLRGLPTSPTYSATKAGLLSWGEAMRGLLAGTGVRVLVALPGYVDTEISRQWGGNKPLVMSAARAARILRQGISANRAVIAFPWILAFGLRLLNWLPAGLADWIIRRFAVYRRGSGTPDAS